jgi:predicted RNA-binding protein (virulence factor B family)
VPFPIYDGAVIQIGKFNTLKVLKKVEFGVFLQGDEDEEILLPTRYLPEKTEVGDEIEVFLYYDSEDRLIATTEKPLAQVGEFAFLKVASVNSIGAFLDWGLPKELFLPYAEQTHPLRVGLKVAVALYIDKTFRIASSMRLDRYADKNISEYKENQKVDLFVVGKSELGFKAVINDKHMGVFYENEVFQDISYGQRLPGFIKKIRDDGKIDLILQPMGSFGAKDLGEKILEVLKQHNGFLAVTDKTSAEKIYDLFGVSKKKYKMALGGLYKKRLVTIGDDGLRLAAAKKA